MKYVKIADKPVDVQTKFTALFLEQIICFSVHTFLLAAELYIFEDNNFIIMIRRK
jgi:hypothetical protein